MQSMCNCNLHEFPMFLFSRRNQSQDMNQTSGNMGLYVFGKSLIEKPIALQSLEDGLCAKV